MIMKGVKAKAVKDSRGENTISVSVEMNFFKKFVTIAPAGKSTGKYESKSYSISLEKDIEFINNLDKNVINEILCKSPLDLNNSWLILKEIEELVGKNIGANTLYAFEASLLKSIANENKKELWNFLGGKKLPRPLGNAIGGGLHSKGINGKRPDFQEFLFISGGETIKKCIEMNKKAHRFIKDILKSKNKNDEGAWETDLSNENVLETMEGVKKFFMEKYNNKIEIGLDIAASSFYKNKLYVYENPKTNLTRPNQIKYIKGLITKYHIYYAEDPMEEEDFLGFAEINKSRCFVCGDDLTTTNPERLKKAIKMKSINAIIVKPNQIGSLLKVKEVIEMAKKNNIKTIISHRSGETTDNTIADLGVGFECDFIKTGISGKVREAKLKRLIKIEKKLKKVN